MKYVLTNSNLTYYLNGKMYTANRSHPRYEDVIEAIKQFKNAAAPCLLEGRELFFEQMTNGNLTSSGEGVVFYKGIRVRNPNSNYIEKYLLRNLPLEPLYRLIEKYGGYPEGEVPSFSEFTMITTNGNLLVCDVTPNPDSSLDSNSKISIPKKIGLKYTGREIAFSLPASLEASDAFTTRHYRFIEVDPRYLFRDRRNRAAYGTFIGVFELINRGALLAVITPDEEVPQEYFPNLNNETAVHINLNKGLPF